MTDYATEQEAFWAGEFGDEYIDRNVGSDIVAANISLFAKILARTGSVRAILELGANRGLNLMALRLLSPGAELSAIELNEKAVGKLRELGYVNVRHESILEYEPGREYDLVFIKGVLIHIDPDHLGDVYERLYRSSRRYVCIVEYYNPTPVEVNYRGHSGRLFKRDFAGEMMDRYADLRLLDYGFLYRRDSVFPNGDLTWFLLEKA
jgi:spore coat polysaccharide biosynthesis protein SpsF